MPKKLTTQNIIEKSNKIHFNWYDYSNINYNGMFEKIEVICPIHGSFLVTPNNHIYNKSGCPKCKGISNTLEFIEIANKIHNYKYNYTNTIYIKNNISVQIICPEHGIFEQLPTNHIYRKSGCPECGKIIQIDKSKVWNLLQNHHIKNNFIEIASEIHNYKYDYSLSNYESSDKKIKIICPEHGIFEQLLINHIYNESGCPKCTNIISKGQKEIYNFINYYNTAILEDRDNYFPYFIDITIPDKKIAIEYNGVYWHSLNQGIRELSHLNEKRLNLEKLGLRVINIYEDEWINSRLQMEQIIKNALGIISNKIGARKCSIWKCGYTDNSFPTHIVPFFNKYHHQGLKYYPESIAYCLVYDNQIVACALFGNNKYHNQNECELIRYATINDIKISGGLSKLISTFHKDFLQFKSIISYCDNRFFTGNSYSKIGFEKISDGQIGYNVIIKNNSNYLRKHRSYITKTNLSRYFKEDYLEKYSQKELAMQLGWLIIPDCGHSKLILRL
jgi:glutaredoxin